MSTVTTSVKLRGPIFDKKITPLMEAIIYDNAIDSIGKRLARGGKGLGAKRNPINRERRGLTETVSSSTIRPRTKGTAWLRKNLAIANSMAPRVLRATATRIVEELG